MNRKEHLLTILSEECIEIAKDASKGLRFGLNDHYPTQTITNAESINLEFNDLLGVIELLNEEGILNVKPDKDLIQKKKEKIEKFLNYSRNAGTLND